MHVHACACGLHVYGYIHVLCSRMCVCGVCVHGYVRMLYIHARVCGHVGTSRVTEMKHPNNDHYSVHGYTCVL